MLWEADGPNPVLMLWIEVNRYIVLPESDSLVKGTWVEEIGILMEKLNAGYYFIVFLDLLDKRLVC